MSDKLANIVYISVPENLERSIGDFQIDADRMLPVEATTGGDRWDIHDLAWEQIIAGMLKIIAYDPEHDDLDYYREFVLAVNPEIIGELTETAIVKSHNGELDMAEEIFLALRGLQPGDQRALINLALLYEQQAEAEGADGVRQQECGDRALEVYSEIFSSDDVIPEAHLNAGYFFLRQRDFEQARNHFEAYQADGVDDERIAEITMIVQQISSQNLADTMFKEAYDLIRSGKEEDGIARIGEFLTENPTVWNAWFLYGWGLRRLRRFDDGRAAFEQALEHGPRQPDTLNELAICHMELDDLVAAEKLLVEALTSEPENTKIISNLGIVALRAGNQEEAEGYFRTVLEIDPNDRIAATYVEGIE